MNAGNMSPPAVVSALILLVSWCSQWACALNATETETQLIIANDRLYVVVEKARGGVVEVILDGQNLLGTRDGNVGIGPYLDCYCTPSGFWTPGTESPTYELYSGTDSTGTEYGGVRMSDTYPATGQVMEQYWFLREGETGLHMFSRLAYYNETTPFLRNLQEMRTLFRPNTPLWTHLSTNEIQHAPLPGGEATDKQVTVQDATWYLGNTPEDPYVQQEADYFTKYTFHDSWRGHDVHGLYADGSTAPGGATYGAWLVMNTRESYFGGPTHSDLTVDGIVYNYLVSNHHGAQTPNITHGFDRTFGPQFYYFNRGAPGAPLADLRADAARYADPAFAAGFYDDIAAHVPNLAPAAERTTWRLQADLPAGARRPVAVLSADGLDFQDNAADVSALQYWAEVGADGAATIPRVRAGTYRLTIYADGVFGQYVEDGVEVAAAAAGADGGQEEGPVHAALWREERAGAEVWRIGTPDRSSGEYRHGRAADGMHPLHPEEYRAYWAVYDFPAEFPAGVRFRVGESDEAADLNYVHWSVFGGRANALRPDEFRGAGEVNNWTVSFGLGGEQVARKQLATLTVQLAGAKTAAGNTDVYNASEPQSNLHYTVSVNGRDLPTWVIPYYQSSSCAVRSAVTCYNVAHKFEFDPADFLVAGENEIVLSLPYGATNYESALLPGAVYVQYDALRLEMA